jgi:hypothetical protein
MGVVYIYALTDPRTSKIRYIGKTDVPLKRLNEHVAEARSVRHSQDNTYKTNWVRQLLSLGLRPGIETLEEVAEENWVEREVWWIAHGREQGWPLTNLSTGGDGIGKISEEGREKIRQNNRTRSIGPGTREKCRQAALGKSPSDETRRKLSEASRGRVPSAEALRKRGASVSAAKLGKPLSEAQRAGLRAYHARNRAVISGTRNPGAKLTDEQVLEIRQQYAQGDISLQKLAEAWAHL